MQLKNIICLSICALAFSACGVNGDRIFGANANDDTVQVDLTQAATMTIDPLGNDGGSGAIIEDVTQGFFGTVTIGTGGLDVEYEPNGVSVGTYYNDWFEYRIRAANFSYSVGRVAVRFTEFASDNFEPDDYQEYARRLLLRFGIPTRETHTSDVANSTPPGAGGTYVLGQTIGGDEDWYIVDIPAAPTVGMATWLEIETILPAVGSSADHNALLITMMDEWGFLAADLLGNPLTANSGTGPGSNDASGNNDATTLDRGLAPGRYLIRINPEFGHRGEYDVTFALREAAPPVLAAPVGVGKLVNPEPKASN